MFPSTELVGWGKEKKKTTKNKTYTQPPLSKNNKRTNNASASSWEQLKLWLQGRWLMEVTLQKGKYDPGIDDPLYSSLLHLWESRT